jgi:hypothetical protein
MTEKQLKRQLEKQRTLNHKKSAFITALKPFVSKKAWDIALNNALEAENKRKSELYGVSGVDGHLNKKQGVRE